jgi:hypothetical protein
MACRIKLESYMFHIPAGYSPLTGISISMLATAHGAFSYLIFHHAASCAPPGFRVCTRILVPCTMNVDGKWTRGDIVGETGSCFAAFF